MDWTNFGDGYIEPPKDKELLAYYENGPLDKGYIIMVCNSSGSYRLPTEKIYILMKWCVIE